MPVHQKILTFSLNLKISKNLKTNYFKYSTNHDTPKDVHFYRLEMTAISQMKEENRYNNPQFLVGCSAFSRYSLIQMISVAKTSSSV